MNYSDLTDFEINKAIARFDEKWNLSDSGCWEWSHGTNKKGYGFFWFINRTHRAHRVSYLLFNGAFKNDLCVCHRCDNPSCVNPEHLFLGTHNDNVQDKIKKGRQPFLKGESNGRAKLENKDISVILARISSGDTCTSIALDYGVHQTTVSRIKLGTMWSHI